MPARTGKVTRPPATASSQTTASPPPARTTATTLPPALLPTPQSASKRPTVPASGRPSIALDETAPVSSETRVGDTKVIAIQTPQAESAGNPLQGIDPDMPLETSVTPKREAVLPNTTKPYIYNGETITPMSTLRPFTQTGMASWYGKKFHGARTASGERYDMYKLSAAHKSLPIPSYVKVTHLDNGKSVIVRVNDRGPFAHQRIIDLSFAAAKQLDMVKHGSARVEITLLDDAALTAQTTAPVSAGEVSTSATPLAANLPDNHEPAESPVLTDKSGIYVQLGAFSQIANAERLISQVAERLPETRGILNKVYNGALYQVMLGPYDDTVLANLAANQIRETLALPTLIIAR